MENENTTPEGNEATQEAVAETSGGEQDGTKLSDVEALQAELNKARQEAAKYRSQRNEFKTDAEKFREYQESQKTEVEKVAERNAELEARLQQLAAEKTRADIALKYGLTPDDYDLLGSGDEETVAARAEKIKQLRELAARAVEAPPSNVPREKLKGGAGDADEPVDDSYPAHWR